MRTFKIYSLSNLQICNTVLLTIVTMLCITSPWLIYFITGSLYLLTTFTQSIPNLIIQSHNLLFPIWTSALPKYLLHTHGIYLVIPCFLLLFVYKISLRSFSFFLSSLLLLWILWLSAQILSHLWFHPKTADLTTCFILKTKELIIYTIHWTENFWMFVTVCVFLIVILLI